MAPTSASASSSSSENPQKSNVASLLAKKNSSFIWKAKNSNVPHFVSKTSKMQSISFKDLKLRAKSRARRSGKEWTRLSEMVHLYRARFPNEKFITLSAVHCSPPWIILLASINHQFLRELTDLPFTVVFDIKGRIETERRMKQSRSTDGGPWNLETEVEPVILDYGSSSHGLLAYDAKAELFEIHESTNPEVWDALLNGDDRRLKINWKVTLEWRAADDLPPIQSNPSSILSRMYSDEETKDFTIVVGSGAEVRCHKSVLAANSSILATMISQKTGMKESETRRVELKEMSEEGIGYLLPYLYGIPLPVNDLSCELAQELFEVAHLYNLPELEKELENILLGEDSNWFTANSLLELYYFSRNLEQFKKLEEHCLKHMHEKKKLEEVKACERFKQLDSEEALKLTTLLTDKP